MNTGVLGFGLLRPFRRDGKSDFAAAGSEQLIRAVVGQILGTRAASEIAQGELPWRPEFGSKLYLLLHQKNNAVLQELARVYVSDALKQWEPRVVVKAVSVTREVVEGEDVLAIRVRYAVISQNVSGNQVFVDQTVMLR
jgi:phage baseplate assembly protein W